MNISRTSAAPLFARISRILFQVTRSEWHLIEVDVRATRHDPVISLACWIKDAAVPHVQLAPPTGLVDCMRELTHLLELEAGVAIGAFSYALGSDGEISIRAVG